MGGVSADGKVLWLSGRYDAEVYAIDTRTGKLLARIPVGRAPTASASIPSPDATRSATPGSSASDAAAEHLKRFRIYSGAAERRCRHDSSTLQTLHPRSHHAPRSRSRVADPPAVHRRPRQAPVAGSAVRGHRRHPGQPGLPHLPQHGGRLLDQVPGGLGPAGLGRRRHLQDKDNPVHVVVAPGPAATVASVQRGAHALKASEPSLTSPAAGTVTIKRRARDQGHLHDRRASPTR